MVAVVGTVGGVACSGDEATAPTSEDNVSESRPGSLVITSPARAAFIEGEGGSVEIVGTGATSALTINGAPAEVGADGSFKATVKPGVGLNVIVAVDGESRLEAPFLYGHFVSANKPVDKAVSLDIGPAALNAPAPAASLTSVVGLALADHDLVGLLKGQKFDGSVPGATFEFTVSGGRSAKPVVALSPAQGGVGVAASLKDLVVEGTLKAKILGFNYSRSVRILADVAAVTGTAQLAVDDAGAMTVSMGAADIELQGFKYDSDNSGLPCCLDSIVSSVLRPRVEKGIEEAVRDQIPKAMKVTLEGMGLPKALDLSMVGVSKPLAIATRFDGAAFDTGGGTVTASVLFGSPFEAGAPGARAPGYLSLGKAFSFGGTRPAAFGVSFSMDAVNQAMFAAWGTGSFSFTVGAPLDAKLTPALPPIVTAAEGGAVKIGLGEILVQRAGSDKPMAAVTVLQDITPSAEADALVLTPKGEATISISWLTDEMAESARNLVAVAAKEQLGKFLKPIRVPVPKFSLDALGPSFAGQSLALQGAQVSVDPAAARLGLAGGMTLAKAAAP